MSDPSLSGEIIRLEAHLIERRGRREGREIRFLCPAHEDRHPSARWNGAKSAWYCDVCREGGGWRDLSLRLGLEVPAAGGPAALAGGGRRGKTRGEVVASHRYTDAGGCPLYEVLRLRPKAFLCRRPDGGGGWRWDLQGVERVLYRLPEVVASVAREEVIFVVEGEKDADALAALGFTATTHAGGAGKWRPEYAEALRGARVLVIPDNDEAGRRHAEAVVGSLRPCAALVKLLELPGLPPKGDVSDWIAARRGEGLTEVKVRLLFLDLCVAVLRPAGGGREGMVARGEELAWRDGGAATAAAAAVEGVACGEDPAVGPATGITWAGGSLAEAAAEGSVPEWADMEVPAEVDADAAVVCGSGDAVDGADAAREAEAAGVLASERAATGQGAPGDGEAGGTAATSAGGYGLLVEADRRLAELNAACEVRRTCHVQALSGARCMADVVAQAVRFLWAPYLPVGKLTLLEGDPGQGKSWLAAAIAAAGSRGRGLPGLPSFAPFRTLFLTAEDGLQDTLRPRLDSLSADCGAIFACEQPLSLDLEADLAALRQMLGACSARLVVIDPLVAFLGRSTDIYRANEVRSVLAPLVKLAEQHGCAILAIRHLNKAKAGRTIYAGQGSIDFTAAARSVLLAGSAADDPTAHALVHIKSNIAAQGAALAYRLLPAFSWGGTTRLTADDLLASSAPADEASAEDDARIFLRTTLAGSEPIPARVVLHAARDAGISQRTLKRAKRREGILTTRHGFGAGSTWLWSLPEAEVGQPGDEGVHTKGWPPSRNAGTDRGAAAPDARGEVGSARVATSGESGGDDGEGRETSGRVAVAPAAGDAGDGGGGGVVGGDNPGGDNPGAGGEQEAAVHNKALLL